MRYILIAFLLFISPLAFAKSLAPDEMLKVMDMQGASQCTVRNDCVNFADACFTQSAINREFQIKAQNVTAALRAVYGANKQLVQGQQIAAQMMNDTKIRIDVITKEQPLTKNIAKVQKALPELLKAQEKALAAILEQQKIIVGMQNDLGFQCPDSAPKWSPNTDCVKGVCTITR